MDDMDAQLRDALGNAVDLSFSQILEAHAWQQQRLRRHRESDEIGDSSGMSAATPGRMHGATNMPRRALGALDEEAEDSEDSSGESARARAAPREDIDRERDDEDDSIASAAEDEDWALMDVARDGAPPGDMYRFVQPRRLSSWVQDDAVNACFKCHTHFTMLLRKHHCRACGRIFCGACSSQRVVIPGDYEATPVGPAAPSLTSNASQMIGNISWYLWSNPARAAPPRNRDPALIASGPTRFSGNDEQSVEEQEMEFLKEIERLQQENVISKFTPCRARSGSLALSATLSMAASSVQSSYVPDGSVLQRVCDDCACALQQRRQHYNIVKIFELCEFNLKELRTLGQVCRKWHRASIMCLSMFRQIQYYLPTHCLSQREKGMLLRNREFLAGHTKWQLQLLRSIDFSLEDESEDSNPNNRQLVKEALELIQQPRQHKCMLTMCSRLCQPEMKSVDALEILSNEAIRNTRLRSIAVDALIKHATEDEWTSFLPVLLRSLSVQSNAAGCRLGQALIRQAQCDVRLCYDLYWGLTVMAEDPGCRRQFDALRQRLLLQLARLQLNAISGRPSEYSFPAGEEIAEQLLRGQDFVGLLSKIPHPAGICETRQCLERSVIKSSLFAPASASETLSMSFATEHWPLLRLPVDPIVRVGGIDFTKTEVKASNESPMVITCTGVQRDEPADRETIDASRGVDAQVSPQASFSRGMSSPSCYRIMYKRADVRKDAIVQNIINLMYSILKQETPLNVPLVTYRVLPTSSFDGMIEIVEQAHTLYAITRDHGNILNFLHHYNGHRTLSEISASFRESLAAYTVITFLLGVGDRHADNVMLTHDGILFHIDYGFILGKDPKPSQPPMRLDQYMIEALGGTQTAQFEQFKRLCVIAFNSLRRHVNLFMIMLTLVVKSLPEITDTDIKYTQQDLEAFVVERFLPGQTDEEAATALMLRMEGKLNEKIGLKLSDFVHAHTNEKTVSKSIGSMGTSVKVGVEAVSTVASSITSGATSLFNYVWGDGMV